MGRKLSKTFTFPAKKLVQLRKRAQKDTDRRYRYEDGWQKSKGDPNTVLDAFKTINLKPGLTLRAYQFVEGGNGNGVVYAMPEDSPFPEPGELPNPPERLWDRPEPPGALDDFMAAIEGDDSPWSYVEASICARELSEFGAMWHGCWWSTHHIVGDEFVENLMGPHWKWVRRAPASLEPEVYFGPLVVRVTFFTNTGLGEEALYRHMDKYQRGTYRAEKMQGTVIAKGRGGYVF